jgi:hypothetical protein
MRSIMKALSLVVAVGMAACSGGKGGGGSSGLSVSTHSAATPTAPSSDSPPGLTLPNGIEITEIRMAIRRISVAGDDAEFACSTAGMPKPEATAIMSWFDPGIAGSCLPPAPMAAGWFDPGFLESCFVPRPPEHPEACDWDDFGHHHHGAEWGDDWDEGCRCRLAYGPFDVDLAGSALTGAVSYAFSAPIPDGTYDQVTIDVNTVSSTTAAGNAVLEDLAAAHASIIVDGWVQESETTTVPFSFRTPMDVKQKKSNIVIAEGSNVTLDFDPTHWFDGEDGQRLDPNVPANRGEILANIRASIRIIKDNDRDGDDDDVEGGGHGEH